MPPLPPRLLPPRRRSAVWGRPADKRSSEERGNRWRVGGRGEVTDRLGGGGNVGKEGTFRLRSRIHQGEKKHPLLRGIKRWLASILVVAYGYISSGHGALRAAPHRPPHQICYRGDIVPTLAPRTIKVGGGQSEGIAKGSAGIGHALVGQSESTGSSTNTSSEFVEASLPSLPLSA